MRATGVGLTRTKENDMTDNPRKLWLDPTGVDELNMYVAHSSDTMDFLNMYVEYTRTDLCNVMHVSFARENMVAKARIEKLQKELEWFAKGEFRAKHISREDLSWRIMRRARSAIKYLAAE
jgi:hypothetical protein